MSKNIHLIYTEIGARIKEVRLRRKLNQDELASAVGVSRITVVYWEGGTNRIQIEQLLMLCAVLKCRIIDLLPPIPAVSLKEALPRMKTIKQKSLAAKFTW